MFTGTPINYRRTFGPRHLLATAGASCLLQTALLPIPSMAQQAPASQQPSSPASVASAKPFEATPEVTALLKQAKTASLSAQWDQMLTSSQAALDQARKLSDKYGEATALRYVATSYEMSGQPEKCLDFYQQAVLAWRAVGDRNGEARVDISIAHFYDKRGPAEKAIEFSEQALALYRLAGNVKDEAGTLADIGYRCINTGRPKKALEDLQAAAAIYTRIGDKTGQARATRDLGLVYTQTGEPNKALAYCMQALTMAQEVNDKQSELQTIGFIGNLYVGQAQYQKALECYQQQLTLRREIGSKDSDKFVLFNIGTVYGNTRQDDKALAYYQQALVLFRRDKDRSQEASTLVVIGDISTDPKQALDYYSQALSVFQDIGEKFQEPITMARMANVYTDTGQFATALGLLQKALVLERQAGDKNGEADALADLGLAYSRKGEPQKALDLYANAIALYRQTGEKNRESKAHLEIGMAYNRLGRPQDALNCFRQGITLVEAVRANVGNETDARATYLSRNVGLYCRAIDTLVKINTSASREEAFLLAQKVKARSLLDRLGTARTDLATRLTSDERNKEASLRDACDQLNRQMVAEGVRNEVGSKKRFEQDKADLGSAEKRLVLYQDSLYAQHPDLAIRRVAQTDKLSDIAAALPENTAMLEFIDLTAGLANEKDCLDRSIAFVITRGGTANKQPNLAVYDLGVTPEKLSMLGHHLHDACARATGDYAGTARSLYDAVLARATTTLKNKRSWIICPDGSLWQTPFGALLDGRHRFVAEDHDLTLAYSATGWHSATTIRRLQAASDKSVGSPNSMLVMADPDFRTADHLAASRFGNTAGVAGQRPINIPDRPINVPDRPINVPDRPVNVPDRPINQPDRPINVPDRGIAIVLPGDADRANAMRALPGTRREANAIALDFPDAKVLTGAAAQEATFKKLAPSCRFIHLATHGFFNDASPLLSSLVLAAPPATGPGSEEDGLLTARELLDLDLSHCELAVLSACNTGVGEQRGGEGIVGLTWSLLAAGCPSQVVSGWPVSDSATVTLMSGFYSALKKGQDKASALRSAELALRKSPATSHPYYWAPFFLVGEAQ